MSAHCDKGLLTVLVKTYYVTGYLICIYKVTSRMHRRNIISLMYYQTNAVKLKLTDFSQITSNRASACNFPEDQAHCVDICSLEWLKMFHIYWIVKHLWSHIPVGRQLGEFNWNRTHKCSWTGLKYLLCNYRKRCLSGEPLPIFSISVTSRYVVFVPFSYEI